MAKEIILKRCPSCGAEARTESYIQIEGFVVDLPSGFIESVMPSNTSSWRVRCKYCSFECGGFQVRSNAIRRWNTRVKTGGI